MQAAFPSIDVSRDIVHAAEEEEVVLFCRWMHTSRF